MMHRTRCGSLFAVGDGRALLRGAVAVTDRGAGVTPGRGTLIADRIAGVGIGASASIVIYVEKIIGLYKVLRYKLKLAFYGIVVEFASYCLFVFF